MVMEVNCREARCQLMVHTQMVLPCGRKKNVSDIVPFWESYIYIQCGNCSYKGPDGVIRARFFREKYLEKVPEVFQSAPINSRGFPETKYSLQVYLEDCTGCNLCVEICPAIDITDRSRKAINMAEKEPILKQGIKIIEYFKTIL